MLVAEAARWLKFDGDGSGPLAKDIHPGTRQTAKVECYAGFSYFFPALGTADRSLHPLMAWWAVLYVLSMLARYQPAEWATHINVDASSQAVRLERILNEAIGTVPNLIAEAIDQVTNPRSYLASVDESGPGLIEPSAW